jgi:hypothetical protein
MSGGHSLRDMEIFLCVIPLINGVNKLLCIENKTATNVKKEIEDRRQNKKIKILNSTSYLSDLVAKNKKRQRK